MGKLLTVVHQKWKCKRKKYEKLCNKVEDLTPQNKHTIN